MINRSPLKALTVSAALFLALTAGGCGGFDSVELNGGIFDALGVSTAAQTAKKREVQVEQRTGLVVPPSLEKLPAPGSGPTAPDPVVAAAWPKDEQDNRTAEQARLRKAHAEYCEKALLRKRSGDSSVDLVGPMGNCEASIINILAGSDLTTAPATKKP